MTNHGNHSKRFRNTSKRRILAVHSNILELRGLDCSAVANSKNQSTNETINMAQNWLLRCLRLALCTLGGSCQKRTIRRPRETPCPFSAAPSPPSLPSGDAPFPPCRTVSSTPASPSRGVELVWRRPSWSSVKALPSDDTLADTLSQPATHRLPHVMTHDGKLLGLKAILKILINKNSFRLIN